MKTLLWDFDGTLGFRQGGMWSAALLQAIHQEDPLSPVTAEQLRPYLQSGFPWHTPDLPHPDLIDADQWWNRVEPVFERALLCVGLDVGLASRLARQVRRIYTHPACWRCFDDAFPTLQRCSNLGWQNALLTNHVPELRTILQSLGLDRWLIAVFNSAETGYEKPHPQSFHYALARLGNPEQVVMIGDNYPTDILGAASQGIPGILVRKGHPDARNACERLDQIPDILTTIRAA